MPPALQARILKSALNSACIWKCTRALTCENVCYALQDLKDNADKRKAAASAQGSKIPDFKGTNSLKFSRVCHVEGTL